MVGTQLNERISSHPDVLTRKVRRRGRPGHMGRNDIFALNPTAARLWELLSEGLSRAEAVEQLKSEFDASEEVVEREADRFMALLEAKGSSSSKRPS